MRLKYLVNGQLKRRQTYLLTADTKLLHIPRINNFLRKTFYNELATTEFIKLRKDSPAKKI